MRELEAQLGGTTEFDTLQARVRVLEEHICIVSFLGAGKF